MESLFKNVTIEQVITKTNDKNPCDVLIEEFKKEINLEREARGFKYKKGDKWIKEKPITFMGTKMKLYSIRNNEEVLREFLSDCKDIRNRTGSFSRAFFGKLKV